VELFGLEALRDLVGMGRAKVRGTWHDVVMDDDLRDERNPLYIPQTMLLVSFSSAARPTLPRRLGFP
jgi:hypothetical protein